MVQAVDGDYDIFLDYPEGRTKPPLPTLTLPQAFQAINAYKSIKHFAVSNMETADDVFKWVMALPKRISFVPKIETIKGVENLDAICHNDRVQYVMLDSEDLYTDVDGDADKYLELKEMAKTVCENNGVELLELWGVVFA